MCSRASIRASPSSALLSAGGFFTAPAEPNGLHEIGHDAVCWAASNCDVHCGQRVAASGIVDWQNGQDLVAGGAGSSRRIRLIDRTTMKIANAMIRKLMTVLMNTP